MALNPVKNIDDVKLREIGDGKSFAAQIGSFGELIGSSGIGCMVHVVAPGMKAFPFHVHHRVDELFIILEGEGTYRFGEDRYPIKAGDVCAAPVGGRDVAHQIINTSEAPLKYLGLSANRDTEVVEYPDSGKFAVLSRFDWENPDAGGIRFVGRVESAVDYYDGEE